MTPTAIRLLLAAAAGLLAAPALAQQATYRGADLYDAVCSRCHDNGEGGAPRIGDRAAWSKLAARGLQSLSASTMQGIRGMPAHAGESTLSELELQRAIAYIVNESGGNWVEPAGPGPKRSGAQIVQAHCAQCHATGFGGAPRIGNKRDWTPRLARGIDFAVRSAQRGYKGMPSRAAEATLSDAELREAVMVLINPGRSAK